MLLSEITKRQVLDVYANKVGNIVDIDLNVSQGTINHFMIKTGTFKKVPVTSDQIDKIGHKIILKVSKADLERPPVAVK
jgi:sporulation protein YlmC with PRC-barrel domain